MTEVSAKLYREPYETTMLYQDLIDTYEDLMKTLDALEDLNQVVCEDCVDMEEEAEIYVEDINGYLDILEDLCDSVEASESSDHKVVRYVRNWKLGKWNREYRWISRFSKVPIKTKS